MRIRLTARSGLAAALTALAASPASPAAAQTCFVYADTVAAPAPLICVQKATLDPPCSYGDPDNNPQDCTTIPDAPGSQTILDMHTRWHTCFGNRGGANPPAGRGQRWYAFHRQFEHDFNQWRRTIGFDPIESLHWCPDMNLPVGTGPELDPGEHVVDCGQGEPRPDDVDCPDCVALAQCLFIEGGGPAGCAASPGCETPNGSVSFPHTHLEQFPNVDDISKILDGQFHGLMHNAVANADDPDAYNRDNADPLCSPRDPMFWRLHKALDDVVRAWQDQKAADVVVVVDRSGSMEDPDASGTTKFAAALAAVDNFAALLEDLRADGAVNRIGIVSYSSGAAVDLPLTDADETLRDAGEPLPLALAALGAGGPGGCTGIGAGLSKAIGLLCPTGGLDPDGDPVGDCDGFAAAGDNDRKAILLLTDGLENRPPCLQPAGAGPNPACGTQCFGPQFPYDTLGFTQAVAVGFGNAGSLNGELLTLMTERQGGIYMQNPNAPGDDLKHFFTKAFGKLTDEFVLVDPQGTLAAADPASEPVEYSSCFDARLTFASGWQTPAAPGELRLQVTTPAGDLVARGAPGVEADRHPTWDFARVSLPHRGASTGTWRAQLVRPHRVYVNGFTPDAFADAAAGVTLVRRQIQRLCPDGCRRVLYFEKERRGPVSVYEGALKAEAATGLVGAVEAPADADAFAQALATDRWDLLVYARMGSEGPEPYDQRLASALCRGRRAIVSETREAGQAILRCAGALRDQRVGFDRLEGDGRLFSGALDLVNPGHPVASYGLRPTVAQVRPQATADAGKTLAVLARAEPGQERRWYMDVLGKGLAKLDVHHQSLEQRTGGELVASARILPSYIPAGGFDRVEARVEVEYPRIGAGTLAGQQRDKRGRQVRGELLDARADALSQVVIPTGRASFPLYDDGTHGDIHPDNAYWTGTLHGLGAVDGAYHLRYIFDFTQNGCTTHREILHTTYVDVRVDPGASKLEVVERVPADGGWRLRLRLRPADRFGNLLGPGRLTTAACVPAVACRVAADGITDHGDGTYTLTVQTAPGAAGVRLAAAGASFDLALPCADCPRLAAVELAVARIPEHSFTKGVVRLAGPAPRGGAVVHLASSNPGAAVVPATVTVAAGQSEATFEVAVHHAHAGPAPATISAVYGGGRATATLTVRPLAKKRVNSREPPATPVPQRHYDHH
ncbi:MAG TPA: VWA domain-containing protein [Thermoanaerobaculia bacterium]|nr:VWA domain-containing protein [Thermoanaerobaculia bacterium]